jgi:transporter family-2 protein
VRNLYWFFAAGAGAGLAAQAGVNTPLRAATGSALWTSLISASLTVVLLAPALLLQRDTLATAGYARYPRWIWTGGIAGAAYVLAAVTLARPLVIDHFGWFNVPVHRLSAERLLGTALLVAGMALIRWR